MSLAGNINEVLKQIQLLVKMYGDVTFKDIEKSVSDMRSR